MSRNPFLDLRKKTLLFILICSSGVSLLSQEKSINYNELYKYPFSFGVEYQNLSPFGDYGADFSIYDISVLLRMPLPFLPTLQPLAQGGMIQFISKDRENPEKWNHIHWYGTLGISYSYRFSKNFEIGAETAAGITGAIFPNLDPEGSRSTFNLLASLGGRACLNPSYSISVDINPSVKYLYSFSPLDKFNGFLFGIGFTVNYRLGEDPDAPQAIIRSIKIEDVDLPPIFAAMQSYYVKNPIGKVTIKNTEKHAIDDVDVSFFQAGFMDTQTKALSIPELGPGESKEVSIFALFNEEVFRTEGVTPLTGEVIVDYTTKRKAVQQKFPVSYDLHDKTALTWDDDSKVGAFITPADSALRNYTSFVRQACKDDLVPGVSEPLQTGMQVYCALTELGCLYQVDPTSPFTAVQENPLIIDSISLSRNTLKRATGDCDDLTVLYCSLLETVGIETAFITVPGHIYAAFNTKVPSKSYREVHPDKNMTLNVDGELWVPVEITMIGSSDFLSAWRMGMEEHRALDKDIEKRNFILTRKAQEIYRPVGLRETDLGLQYGSREALVKDFRKSMSKLVDRIIEDYMKVARESGNKRDYNRLGIACAKFARYSQAEKAFNTALSLDRNYLSPKTNLGNIFFLKGEYQEALRSYHSVEESLVENNNQRSSLYTKVLLNISKSYYELENYDKSAEYFEKLISLDPSFSEQFSYLTRSEEPATRSADMSVFETVLFSEEEF
jgi:hypothetical protein